MKNEAWFYKGVRYAKDGRYACYCNTPQKKRTVLLKNTLVTLAIEGGSKGLPATITPFNVNSKEVLVKYNADKALLSKTLANCQAFTDSNYFIFHNMSTGQYYCYYIDYIETIQQTGDESGEGGSGGELISFPNNVTFRVGISIDWWQTYFFKMRTKAIDNTTKPTYCPPHSTASQTVNEIIMPDFDFANISRTNISTLLRHIYTEAFRPITIPNLAVKNGKNVKIPIMALNATTPGSWNYAPYCVLVKLNIANDKYVWCICPVEQAAIRNSFSNADIATFIQYAASLLISSGKITKSYEPNSTFGNEFSVAEGSQYSLDEAYIVPTVLIQQVWGGVYFPNQNQDLDEINNFTIAPLNMPLDYRAYPTPFNNINSIIAYGNNRRKNSAAVWDISYMNILTLLAGALPGFKASQLENALPYITVGLPEQAIPIVPAINSTVSDNKDILCPSFFYQFNDIAFSIAINTTYDYLAITISNGSSEIDVTQYLKLSIRGSADNEEIARQKNAADLAIIGQGISLLGGVFTTGASIMAGNAYGAVMSSVNLANQGVGLINSLATYPDFEKQKKSYTASGGTPNAWGNALFGISLMLPLNRQDDDFAFTNYYACEYSEIGIDCHNGGIIPGFNSSLLLGNTSTQKYGYVEMGCVLLNMPQEPGETLERRFREGVTFWYV